MQIRIALISVVVAFLNLGTQAIGQTQTFAKPRVRIVNSIDESTTVTFHGNVHPVAAAASTWNPADPGTPMEHMILYLKPDASQQAQLAQLIAQQHDPKSPLYHHFLTPQAFGAQFGAAQSDLGRVTTWLQSHGFTVEQLPAGNLAVVFSGTAEQVTSAFRTEIRQYNLAGANHYANANDPQIPAALADAVGGIVKLHDFRHAANLSKTKALTEAEVKDPQYTYGSGHYLAPSDYGILYDIAPLYNAGINGTGQSIAVLARSNIHLSDVQSFRSFSGLAANEPQIVITNTDPGVLQGDSVETTLDTEWSGAVAPKATIKVIVSESTNSTDGIDLSALYAVNHNIAPIVGLSYGSCEQFMGSGELAFYNSLWQQAAAQGQSVMVSAGDSGSAGCDGGGDRSGLYGKGVNGLCSSPYSTCVGGTEFIDNSNPGQYWLPGDNSTNGSAISYIPETIWNESGSNEGSDLWAGGGGASAVYSKPSWQTGPGVPADGVRDVPDISLTASSHDGYLIWLNGGLNAVGGTSAAAPSFAGLMALVDQKTNARQGLVNTTLYPLAINQAVGGARVFHDITTGSNTVPGVKGFSAATGYDLASGIGTVDANLLVNHWTDAAKLATLSLTASSTSLSVLEGQTAQMTVTSTAGATLSSAVTLSVSGAPTCVTPTLASTTIAYPGSGSVVLKISAASCAVPGSYTLRVTGTGGGQTAMLTISIVIPKPSFVLTASAASVGVMAGSTGRVSFISTPQNGFSSAVALSVVGLPANVTAAFSPVSLNGSTITTSTLTFTVAKAATAGSYRATINATGGGVTQTSSVNLVVTVPASCTLAANPASASMIAGQSASLQVSCGSPVGTFSGPLALTVSGAPSGATASLAAGALAVGSSTALTIRTQTTTVAANYQLSLTASGSGFSGTLSIPLTVTKPSTFAVSVANSAFAIRNGASGQVSATSLHVGTFNSAVAFSVTGLPAGVTASLSRSTLPAPGDGTVVATLAVASSAKTGTYTLFVTGAGGGITQTVPVTLTISPNPDFSLALNLSSLKIPQGSSGTVIVSTGNYTGGFNGQISISFSGLPTGMNWSVIGANTANNLVNVSDSFSMSKYALLGTYPVTVTASGSGISHSAVVLVTVTAASPAK